MRPVGYGSAIFFEMLFWVANDLLEDTYEEFLPIRLIQFIQFMRTSWR